MNIIDEKSINKALDKSYKLHKDNAYFGNGFKAGVQFALDTISNRITVKCIKELDEALIRRAITIGKSYVVLPKYDDDDDYYLEDDNGKKGFFPSMYFIKEK